jgi:hypothetical protein
MLVIREAQMEALRAHRRQRFEDAVTAHLLRRDGGDPVAARESARSAIREASGIGLRTEGEIFRWIELMHWLNAHTDRRPWADAIVSDPELTPALKLRLLEDGAGT